MKRYRWLNDRDVFRYVGRACPERKGQTCQCTVLPPYKPVGAPKNALVRFGDGHQMVVPHGTLRRS